MNGNFKGHNETGYAVASFKVESPPPPPPGFSSTFQTLQEWLVNLCDSNQQPDTIISEYMFVLSDPPGDVGIYLVGYTDTVEQGIPTRRVGHKPINWYFTLPKKEYGRLRKQQLRERVLSELKEFIKTPIFNNSFLSKGYSIRTNFTYEIWLR